MSQDILVPWSRNLKLTWDDFTGPIEQKNQMAWVYSWLEYSNDIELIEKRAKTKFMISDIRVIAYFLKSRSWVRPEMKVRQDQAN